MTIQERARQVLLEIIDLSDPGQSIEIIARAIRAVERETWQEANQLLNKLSMDTGWRGMRRDRILSTMRLRAEAEGGKDVER